jgi:hypothetical protein
MIDGYEPLVSPNMRFAPWNNGLRTALGQSDHASVQTALEFRDEDDGDEMLLGSNPYVGC